MTGHDTRLVPAAAVGWLGAAAAVIAGMRWQSPTIAALLVTGALAVPCAIAVHRRRSVAASLALVVAVCVPLVTGLHVHHVVTGPMAMAARDAASVEVRLRITGDPVVHEARMQGGRRTGARTAAPGRVDRVLVDGAWHRVDVPVLLSARADAGAVLLPLVPGTQVLASGIARPSRVGQRAAATLDVREVTVLRGPPAHQRAAAAVRAGLRTAVRDRPADAAALLPSLAIGDTSLASIDLRDAMRDSGLAHLTVVSGANVAITLAATFAVLAMLGIRGRVAVAAAGAVLIGFVVLARPDPSVLRAAVMGAVALLAIVRGLTRTLRGGSSRSLPALAAAVVLLVTWDPFLSTSWGFALSVAATAGLVVAARPLSGLLRTRLPRRMHPVADALAVTLAAQTAVAPVLLAMGAALTPVAIPANVLAAPAVPVATVSGLAAAVLSPAAPALARVVAVPGTWATGWIAQVARRGSALEVSVPRLPWSPWPPRDWRLLMCDVGQGMAVAARTGEASAVLIDVGPQPDSIDRCLRDAGIRVLDAVVLTHLHADHVDGITGALAGRRVREVVIGPLAAPPRSAALVSSAAARAGVPVRVAAAGERLAWPALRWQVLWPAQWLDTASPENDHSVVSLLDLDGLRVVVTGDVEEAAQQHLVALVPEAVDVVTVPHHGSATQWPPLAQRLRPRIALVPVGRDNEYGHPARSALALYASVGARIGRTDDHGDLAVVLRAGAPVLLARR